MEAFLTWTDLTSCSLRASNFALISDRSILRADSVKVWLGNAGAFYIDKHMDDDLMWQMLGEQDTLRYSGARVSLLTSAAL